MVEIGILLAFLFLLFLLIVLCFLFVLQRVPRPKNAAEQHGMNDLSSMIMFQTMRDVIGEQKELARDFNRSFDRKIKVVRQVIDAAKQREQQLVQAQRELVRLLQEAGHDVSFEPGSMLGGVEVEASETVETPAAPRAKVAKSEPPAQEQRFVAIGHEPEEGDNLIDAWAGLDFGAEDPLTVEDEVPEEPPESPEDAEAARDAFRSLLNLGGGAVASNGDADEHETEVEEEDVSPARAINGAGNTSPLQRRVYEYSDSGMSVSEIAKELGVGKGEVRLILSLRQKAQ